MRFRQILGVQMAIANAEMKVMRSHQVVKRPEEAMMRANKESNKKVLEPKHQLSRLLLGQLQPIE
jgi:hypothetical protein